MHAPRTPTALVVLAALLAGIAPAGAAPAPIALEGRIVDLDGRAATGHTVVLVDASGATVATATTDDEGDYAFAGVAEGDYALGVRTPAGDLAPVAAPPMHLGRDAERRDLKLMRAPEGNAQVAGNYGIGLWWAGLSPAGKTWVIVAVVAAAGLTYSALDNNNNNETNASPSEPLE